MKCVPVSHYIASQVGGGPHQLGVHLGYAHTRLGWPLPPQSVGTRSLLVRVGAHWVERSNENSERAGGSIQCPVGLSAPCKWGQRACRPRECDVRVGAPSVQAHLFPYPLRPRRAMI